MQEDQTFCGQDEFYKCSRKLFEAIQHNPFVESNDDETLDAVPFGYPAYAAFRQIDRRRRQEVEEVLDVMVEIAG